MKNELSKLIKWGNAKIPKETAVFNLGKASDCPSRALGLCQCPDICYAMNPERRFPKVVPQYRDRQKAYWLSHSADEFLRDFKDILTRKRNKYNALRFDESGDFWSQECVNKMAKIAKFLKPFGITTYCYTSRSDLDFSDCKYLHIMGSGFNVHGQFKVISSISDHDPKKPLCCGDCHKCNLCQHYTGTIEVVAH